MHHLMTRNQSYRIYRPVLKAGEPIAGEPSDSDFCKMKRESRVRRTRLQTGNLLVRGPETIHLSDAIGRTYVSAASSLFWHCREFVRFRSCRIYCDACGDESSGFLLPLARLASWNRSRQAQGEDGAWPNFEVELLELPLDCIELQQAIGQMQQQLDQPQLQHFGLPTRRDFGESKTSDAGHLTIKSSAGSQWLERSFWIAEAEQFKPTFDGIVNVVRRLGSAVDTNRWVEQYDQTPLGISCSWHWDYKRQETE